MARWRPGSSSGGHRKPRLTSAVSVSALVEDIFRASLEGKLVSLLLGKNVSLALAEGKLVMSLLEEEHVSLASSEGRQ